MELTSGTRTFLRAFSGYAGIVAIATVAGYSTVLSFRATLVVGVLAICVLLPAQLSLQVALWSLLLVSFARRLVDHQAGSPQGEYDFLILMPYAAFAVVALKTIKFDDLSQIFRRLEGARIYVIALTILTIVSGLMGLMRFGAVGALQLLNYAIPFLAFPVAACLGWIVVRRSLRWFLRTSVPVVLFYGYVQLYVTPSWDLEWLQSIQAETVSFGRPEIGQFRLYGTFSAPLLFAMYLAVAILAIWYLSVYPVIIRASASLLMLHLLLETEIRTALVALLIALGVSYTIYRRKISAALISIALVGITSALIAPIAAYFGSAEGARSYSVDTLSADRSWTVRLSILQDGWIRTLNPIPRGVGALNRGSSVFDNGYISMGIELGLLGLGSLLLLFIIILRARLMSSATGLINTYQAFALTIVTLYMVAQASAPVIQSTVGVFFWIAVGSFLSTLPYESSADRTDERRKSDRAKRLLDDLNRFDTHHVPEVR